MKTAEIRRRWLDFFGERGHTIVPSASLVSDDPDAAVHRRRHGAVHPVPDRAGARAVPARHERAEVHPHPRHRRGRQDHAARHVLPDERQLLASATTSRRRRSRTPGSSSPRSETTAGSASPRRISGSPSTRTTTRRVGVWKETAGLPDERIQRLGKDDNYWSTGLPGPGRARAPRSSSTVARSTASDGGPATDDDRYVEIWNLVFMQYLHARTCGRRTTSTIVGELPKKNIDTGMGTGARRVPQAGRRQHVRDRPGAPRPRPCRRALRSTLRRRPRRRRAHARHRRPRALVPHAHGRRRDARRNEGRGYILRRLMRRVVRAMRLLGVDEPSFPELFAASRDAMKRRLPGGRDRVLRASRGSRSPRRRRSCAPSPAARRSSTSRSPTPRSRAARPLAGDTAFLLHDTFGFPIDLTLEIAEEAGLIGRP